MPVAENIVCVSRRRDRHRDHRWVVSTGVHHEENGQGARLGSDPRAYCARNAQAFLGSVRGGTLACRIVCIQNAVPKETVTRFGSDFLVNRRLRSETDLCAVVSEGRRPSRSRRALPDRRATTGREACDSSKYLCRCHHHRRFPVLMSSSTGDFTNSAPESLTARKSLS